ncbi:MAG TPA: nuclear transport factor 2 family protein [Streptosporangiaceae bacterium]|nr:nuclear transport factor 2 family protein [Streptosporangiaceae bacterium]
MKITIADRLEIEDLAARYNLAIDLGDADSWVSCFCAGGELIIDKTGEWSSSVLGLAEGRWRGASELHGFAAGLATGPQFRHWSYNRVLTPADGGIESVSYMNVYYLQLPAGDQLLTGVMRDRLVHGETGWKFASRRIEFDR